jgi:hypothetical protein
MKTPRIGMLRDHSIPRPILERIQHAHLNGLIDPFLRAIVAAKRQPICCAWLG